MLLISAIKELTGNFGCFSVTKNGVEHVHIERGGAFHNEAFAMGNTTFFFQFFVTSVL